MPTISVLMPCHNCAPTLPAALDSLLGQSFCDFEILAVNNPHHPEIILLGAGRESRKRAAWLKQEGIRVTAYADISPGKIGQKISGRRVLPVHELPPPGQCFCLSYVGQRGMGSRYVPIFRTRDMSWAGTFSWLPDHSSVTRFIRCTVNLEC